MNQKNKINQRNGPFLVLLKNQEESKNKNKIYIFWSAKMIKTLAWALLISYWSRKRWKLLFKQTILQKGRNNLWTLMTFSKCTSFKNSNRIIKKTKFLRKISYKLKWVRKPRHSYSRWFFSYSTKTLMTKLLQRTLLTAQKFPLISKVFFTRWLMKCDSWK